MSPGTRKLLSGLALVVGLGAILGAVHELSRGGLKLVFAGGPTASFVLHCDGQPRLTSLLREQEPSPPGSAPLAAAQLVDQEGSAQARDWLIEETGLAVLREKSLGHHVVDVVGFFGGYWIGAEIASAWRGDCEEEIAAHGDDDAWWAAKRVVAVQSVCAQLAERTDVDEILVNKVRTRITLRGDAAPCDARWLAALRGDEGTSVALTRLACGEPNLPARAGPPRPGGEPEEFAGRAR